MSNLKSIMKQIFLLIMSIVFISTSIPSNVFASTDISSDSAGANVVYIKDFGAYGDGVHDDTVAINNALNSGANTVVFDKDAYYKTNDRIFMKTAGVTIIGNNATLFTDNDYRTLANYYEWYFNVIADDITIEGLNILANETIQVGYKTQFTIRLASNIVVDNCTFTVPSTVLSDASTHELEYSNCDVYTGWHNVTITNCKFTQLADTLAGGNCGFRDIWNKGADTALFENNICTSNSHDEIFALFSSQAKISNITVRNNEFKGLDGTISKDRNLGITLGYPNNRGIEGVVFMNNIVDIKSDYSGIYLGDSTNVSISDNTITYQTLEFASSSYLFRGNISKDNSVTITNNDISIIDNTKGSFGGLVSGEVTFSNNTTLINTDVATALFDTNVSAIENTVTVNGATRRITTGVQELADNTITLNDSIPTMFEFYNTTLTNDISITGNTIICNKKTNTNDTLLMLNGTKLNGYLFTLSENTVTVKKGSSQKTLYYINLGDETSQKIQILDNSTSKYTNTNVSKQCAKICDING